MDLTELRNKIDDIDRQLVKLFCKRMDIVQSVAKYKQENNLPIFQKGREDAVLEKAASMADEKYSENIKSLFCTMMDISKSSQHKLLFSDSADKLFSGEKRSFPKSAKVCCQGVEGAFSHKACNMLFENADISFAEQFEDVFEAVESGECEFGILPIENSSAGSVTQVYDLMKKHSFYISKSIKVKVEHCLLAKDGVNISEITDIYSHPQAISQCSHWLKNNPQIRVHSVSNTAYAAKLISESDSLTSAAISSEKCAELYGLNILKKGLQNTQNNYTRFICIRNSNIIYDKPTKISVILSLEHKSGSLYRVLSRFAFHGINLTKIESRPIPDTDFEFLFYFDLDIPDDINEVYTALHELKNELDTFVFLGAYSEV